MVIAIKQEKVEYLPGSSIPTPRFEGEEYVVDLARQSEPYVKGDLIIYGTPFSSYLPLWLSLRIRADGQIAFKGWTFNTREPNNPYFQADLGYGEFIPTEEQLDTVSGLFSGRIRFEGLQISIGRTIQEVCPIDLKAEEYRIGKKIKMNDIKWNEK